MTSDATTPSVDDIIVGFGKYRDLTPDQIGDEDPGYIVWAYETIGDHFCSKELYESCVADKQEQDFDDYALCPEDIYGWD